MASRTWVSFVTFCLVGVANTAVSWLVYVALLPLLPYLAANVAGWCAGVVFSFFVNCAVTWRVRPTWRRFVLFPLSSVPNVMLSSVGVALLVEAFGLDARVAGLIGMAAAVPISYLLARRILTGAPARG